jgi:ABC-type multidrug transport system ATPase subunit
MLKIELQHISKRFGKELLFDDISLAFTSPSSTALLGINGSGKSTLLQIAATNMLPSKGEVVYELNGTKIEPERIFSFVSFCAPYLEVIEEMTLTEFFEYHFSFKKPLLSIDKIITYIGLDSSRDKLIENFSSGMKQRVKLAQAIFADTQALFLDEPCTNLDEIGITLYERMIEEYCRNRILIVASNDEKEYRVCSQQLKVNNLD